MVEQRQAFPLGSSEFLTHRIHKPSKTLCFMSQSFGAVILSVYNDRDKNQSFVGHFPVPSICIFISHNDPRWNVLLLLSHRQEN